MTKDEVADALDEIGTLLELKGENPSARNAYHNGARTIQQLDGTSTSWSRSGKLGEVRGIGETLSGEDHHARHHRRAAVPEDLRAEFPRGSSQMLRLPGLGPKKVKALHDALRHRHHREAEGRVRGRARWRSRRASARRRSRRFSRASRSSAGRQPRPHRPRAAARRWHCSNRSASLPGVIRSELCGSLRRRQRDRRGHRHPRRAATTRSRSWTPSSSCPR